MWQSKAVVSLLLEEIGSLPDGNLAALAAARRRATFVVALEWLAIVVLIVLQDRGVSMLTLGATEQTVFTVGILVVAVHSGFRLGQLDKLRALERLVAEISAREDAS